MKNKVCNLLCGLIFALSVGQSLYGHAGCPKDLFEQKASPDKKAGRTPIRPLDQKVVEALKGGQKQEKPKKDRVQSFLEEIKGLPPRVQLGNIGKYLSFLQKEKQPNVQIITRLKAAAAQLRAEEASNGEKWGIEKRSKDNNREFRCAKAAQTSPVRSKKTRLKTMKTPLKMILEETEGPSSGS